MKKRILSLAAVFSVLLVMMAVGGISVFAAGEKVVITECDSLDGWSSTAGGNALMMQHGVGGAAETAVGVNVGAGKYAGRVYTAAEPVDISGCTTVEWDMRFAGDGGRDLWNEIKTTYVNDVKLTLTDNSGNALVFALDKMTVAPIENNASWMHFSVDLANSTSGGDAFVKTALKTFCFETTANANAAVVGGNIRIDSIAAVPADGGEEGGGEQGGGEEGGGEQGGETEPPVNKENPAGALWLSDCDSKTGWASAELVLDTENKTEGTGSVGAHAAGGVLKEIVYKPAKALDVSGYKYIEFDMYLTSVDWFNKCGGVMVEITSSGKCDVESNRYQKGRMKDVCPEFKADVEAGADLSAGKWYHFKFEIQNPQGQANGGLNAKALNYFRFYSVDAGEGTKDYDMRIDNIRFTNDNTPGGSDEGEGGESENDKPITETGSATAAAAVGLLAVSAGVVLAISKKKK